MPKTTTVWFTEQRNAKKTMMDYFETRCFCQNEGGAPKRVACLERTTEGDETIE
jgi:hypothetical protein